MTIAKAYMQIIAFYLADEHTNRFMAGDQCHEWEGTSSKILQHFRSIKHPTMYSCDTSIVWAFSISWRICTQSTFTISPY
ncbi:hypothetical protein FKM82_013396 [Ascaphus truei]